MHMHGLAHKRERSNLSLQLCKASLEVVCGFQCLQKNENFVHHTGEICWSGLCAHDPLHQWQVYLKMLGISSTRYPSPTVVSLLVPEAKREICKVEKCQLGSDSHDPISQMGMELKMLATASELRPSSAVALLQEWVATKSPHPHPDLRWVFLRLVRLLTCEARSEAVPADPNIPVALLPTPTPISQLLRETSRHDNGQRRVETAQFLSALDGAALQKAAILDYELPAAQP